MINKAFEDWWGKHSDEMLIASMFDTWVPRKVLRRFLDLRKEEALKAFAGGWVASSYSPKQE